MAQVEQAVPRARVAARRQVALIDAQASEIPRRLGGVLAWLERNSLFVAAAAAIAVVDLSQIPNHLSQDGWLSLVGGRYVATHGVPTSDSLNVLTHGVRWVDQQWLRQLLLYGVNQIGGLFLFSAVYVGLTILALGLAIGAARSLGGTDRIIIWVLPITGFLYVAGSFVIRTQGLAYPFFVAVLWLLAKETRGPASRRVYMVLPLLVVWANLHGSASVGAGLAVLYGLTLLVEDFRVMRVRHVHLRAGVRLRTAIFLLAPPICLLMTPYLFSTVGYYRETLLNPMFGRLITEWRPVTSAAVLAVPCLGLAAAAIWLLGRSGKRTRLFDQLTLIMLAAGAVFAIRNITWFGLAAAVLLPSCIRTVVPERPPAPRRMNVNLAIALTSLVLLAGTLIAVAARPASWFERTYPKRALATVETLVKQQPSARIFADVRYSDWLLWHDPALAGKLAYDTRFELLSGRQLLAIAQLGAILAPHQLNILAGYQVLVLDPSSSYTKLLLLRPATRVVMRNSEVVVALTPGR